MAFDLLFLLVAAMGVASFIVAGCMSCYALAVLGIFVAGQILFFLVMEVIIPKSLF